MPRGIPCDICGYRFTAGDLMAAWSIVCFRNEGSFYGKKRIRWPARKRAGCICPECGHRQVLVTDVSRDLLEMA
jgi:DNA-directed RNA polymerase subunit RPC12/RpoP